MKNNAYKISAKLWLYTGNAGWYFITIPKSQAEEIKLDYIWPRRGFGAIPVLVKLGQSQWKTSIFPVKNGDYLLPVKKEIRQKEKLSADDVIKLDLEVRNDA